MSNFLSGLLSAATSFLPGGGLISKLVPGAVSAIGDIAGKVMNRPSGQGIGQALLEAAPGALMNAAGLAQTAGEHFKEPANIGQQGSSDANAKQTEWWLNNMVSNGGSPGDPYPNIHNLQEAAQHTRDYPQLYYNSGDGGSLPDKGVLAKYGAPGPLGQLGRTGYENYVEPTSASTSATDHLPIMHGPASQPPVMQNASGPFASHGMPPSAAYVDEKMQKQERPQTSTEQMMTQPMYHPNMWTSRNGGPTMMDRTQQQSFGNAPSFNIFDKLARRPAAPRVVEVVEPEILEDEVPDRTVVRYIKRKALKKKGRR